jgi:RHS repeat-associated protein
METISKLAAKYIRSSCWRAAIACGLLAGVTLARAQVADDSTGVPVAIRMSNLNWTASWGATVSIDASGLNGDQSGQANYPDGATPRITAQLAVGKTYELSINTTNNESGDTVEGFSIEAIPPPGYVMEIERVPTEKYDMTYVPISVRLRVRPPADTAPARAGEATSLGTERTLWQASLGSLSNGQSAGAISFIDTGAASDVSSIFKPDGLVYDAPSSDVDVLTNPWNAAAPYVPNTIRQIIAPEVCVDVYMSGTDQCELKFYHRSQLGSYNNGYYSFNGYPYAWYFFNQQGAQPNQVQINCDTRPAGADNVVRTKITTLTRSGSAPNYTWTAEDWYGSNDSPIVESVRARNGSSETLTTEIPGQAAAAQLNRAYTTMPWGGDMVTTETLGTTNAPTTNYDYWSSVSDQSGAYARVRSQISGGGEWEAYEYYDYSDGAPGKLYRVHRPFNNSDTSVPSDLSSDSGQITTYGWSVDPFGAATRLASSQTTVAGVVTAKTTVSYATSSPNFSGHANLRIVTATKQDYSGDNTWLTTITKYFAEDSGRADYLSGDVTEDFFRNQIHSIQQPNGVKQSFAYQRGTWNGSGFALSGNGGLDAVNGVFASRISVITGTANGGESYTTHDGYDIDDLGLIDGKSTLQVTIRDNYARVVRTESYVRSSGAWQLVSAVNFEWNLANQLTKRVTNTSTSYDLSTGTVYEAGYDGEFLNSETAETGIQTTYSYDTAGRLDVATQQGAGAISSLATKLVYDAAGHVTEQHVGWGQTEQLVTTRSYDLAGRVSSESKPGPNGPITTSYAYDPTNRTVTETLPNGGTRTQVFQADGTTAQVTGSATIPEYYTYQILSDGSRYARTNYGASDSARLHEAWSDWLGRGYKTSHPGYAGQPAYVEQALFDGTTGQLSTTTHADQYGNPLLADTLYTYDELGQLTRSGAHINGQNGLDPASNDRIVDSDQHLENFNGAWWITTQSKTYPKLSDATAVTTTKRRRVSGLYGAYPNISGIIVAEELDTDADGNTADQTTIVDRSGVTTTVATTLSGFTGTATQTIVDGMATSSVRLDGLTYTAGYDSLHRKSTTTDPRTGSTTTYYKNGSTFVDHVTDAATIPVASYGYDGAGRVISVTNAGNKVTRTEYNTLDQVVHQWGDTGYPTESVYDGYGQRTELHTFQSGTWTGTNWPGGTPSAVTKWHYDPASGLLSSKEDAANRSVSYTYNARGQTATRTWARNVTTTYNYDGNTGELLSQTYSDSTPSVSYTYTRSGQIYTVDDATGHRDFVYDQTIPSQLDAVALSGYYGNRTLTRQYDSIHRGAGLQIGAELTQTYTYNSLGQFDHLDTTSSAANSARTFSYGYNAGGLLSSLVMGSSFVVNRGYEANRDLLTSIDSLWGGTSQTRYEYTYNSLAQRSTALQSGAVFADFGGSTYYRHIYNDRGELVDSAAYQGTNPNSTTSPQLSDRHFKYSFDAIGNRLTASRTGDAGVADAYTLDPTYPGLNQYATRQNNYARAAGTVSSLTTSVSAAGGGMGWGAAKQGCYWAVDAQRSSGASAAAVSISVSATIAGGDPSGADVVQTLTRTAYLPPQTQAFTYDLDGNLTGDGLWSYSYDAENRLVSMTSVAIAGFPNQLLDFQYDYLGRRVQKKVANWNGSSYTLTTARRYLYDGDNLVAEYDAPGGSSCGNLLKSYSWGLDLAGSLTATGGVGALVQITDHATSTSYLPTYDGNGNVASLIQAADGNGRTAGTVVAKYEYSPFGELLRAEGVYALSNPFRFSTKFTDDETGLVYYGARFYSPSLGRFINRDPIEERGGLNLYGFCGNDGINGFDVLGNKNFFSKFWNKFRHTIISTAIRVVGDVVGAYFGVPTLGEWLSGAYNVAVGASYGGIRGAAWAAAGSYSGYGGGYTNFAATAHGLYSEFGHGGNFFTNFRDWGENYLVAAGTQATLAGGQSAAHGDGFTRGFSDNVAQQIDRTKQFFINARQQAYSLALDGKFLRTTMVFAGPLKVIGYEEDYTYTPYSVPDRLSPEEIAAWRRVAAIDRQRYEEAHPDAFKAVVASFDQYRRPFSFAVHAVDHASITAVKGYFALTGGAAVAEALPELSGIAKAAGNDIRMRFIAQALQVISSQPAEENVADVIINEQMSGLVHAAEGPSLEEAAAEAEGLETTASGAEEASAAASGH